MNETDEKLVVAAKKGFWFGANLGLVAILVMATWSCIDFIREPVLRMRAGGPVRDYEGVTGAASGVSVKLADPSVLDRIVAASPSISVIVMSMAVLIYLSWGEWREIETSPDKLGTLRALPTLFVGVALMLLPICFQALSSFYFEVQISFDWDPVSVLTAFLVVTHLFQRAVQTQNLWVKEYKRAQELDQQMKEVV